MSTEATEAARIMASILDNKDARITALEAENERLRALVREARPSVEIVVRRIVEWEKGDPSFHKSLLARIDEVEQGFTPTNTEDQ